MAVVKSPKNTGRKQMWVTIKSNRLRVFKCFYRGVFYNPLFFKKHLMALYSLSENFNKLSNSNLNGKIRKILYYYNYLIRKLGANHLHTLSVLTKSLLYTDSLLLTHSRWRGKNSLSKCSLFLNSLSK